MAYKTHPMLKLYFENHEPIEVKLAVEKQTSAHIAAATNIRQHYDGHNEEHINHLAEQERYASLRYVTINKNIDQLCEILYNEEKQFGLTLEEASKVFKKHLNKETEMLLIHLADNWMKDHKFTIFQLMKANVI